MSNTNPQPQQPASQPSLIGGHAEYIKGTAEVFSFLFSSA
jgi:hypothetical protein